jgi:hypothetical protein
VLIWGVLYLFTVSRLRNLPCPGCGKNFFGDSSPHPELCWGASVQTVVGNGMQKGKCCKIAIALKPFNDRYRLISTSVSR